MITAPRTSLRSLCRDRWIQCALLGACILQFAVLWLGAGARNGDAVEHLERASDLARGLELGGDATRGPLLSLLLAGLRLALDAIGWRGALALRLLGEGLAAASSAGALLGGAALAGAYGGPRAARLAAWMIASSPVFAAWGAQATSAPLATCALLAGAYAHAQARHLRGALGAGALLGLAIAAKYQLVFLAPLALFLPAAPGAGARGRRLWAAVGLAGSAFLFAGLADACAYGSPWTTSAAYLRANLLPPLYALAHPLLPQEARLALHEQLFDVEAGPAIREGLPLARRKPLGWYLQELPAWLPLPWIALAVAGACSWLRNGSSPRAARPERRACFALGVALALHFAALALKGEKELRLLFPLVPLLAAASSWPIATLAESRRGALASALLGALAATWPWLQLRGALPAGELGALQRHSAYASAMRELERSARWPGDPPERVVGLFHFAVALEERPGLVVQRPPIPLDRSSRARGAELDELRAFFAPASRALFRAADAALVDGAAQARALGAELGAAPGALRVVRGSDGEPALELRFESASPPGLARELQRRGFAVLELGDARPHLLLGHAAGFREQLELWRLANEHYRLVGALAASADEEELDELWVLARADRASEAWPFARRHEPEEGAAVRGALGQPLELPFVDAEGRGVIELVGVEVEPRWARDGFALVRWLWRATRELAPDAAPRAARRATAGTAAQQIDGPIGGGLFAADAWSAGELREETVLLPLRGLVDSRAPGSFALWVALFDARGAALTPVDRSRFPRSPDGLVRVGGGIAERQTDRSFPARADRAGR
ncbi:MAG: glycosyltransferase family 39 protein [Planctomycetes bacterium]|nr:glycosyltransferase family 39 protein [Planctomycetota bacterium]